MADDDNGDTGTPANEAPPEQQSWEGPKSQADLDAIIEKRLSRERARFKDYDRLKERAEYADSLDAELASETEKAARKAADEARTATRNEFVPRVVKAEFRAASKDAGLSTDQLSALLEDLDLSKYVDADGEPDEEKIARKVKAVAPAAKDDTRDRFPDLGGGPRGKTARTFDMDQLMRRQAGVIR